MLIIENLMVIIQMFINFSAGLCRQMPSWLPTYPHVRMTKNCWPGIRPKMTGIQLLVNILWRKFRVKEEKNEETFNCLNIMKKCCIQMFSSYPSKPSWKNVVWESSDEKPKFADFLLIQRPVSGSAYRLLDYTMKGIKHNLWFASMVV